MDIVVVAITLIASFALSRPRALPVAVLAWVFGLCMVAFGPAHNSNVHLGSAGFWAPWSVLLLICVGIVFGLEALKRRWARPRAA